MNMQTLKDMDKDDLLALLGLETKRGAAAPWLQSLGIFGVGLLLGAGAALLLAPKTGSDLRQELRARLGVDEPPSRNDATNPSS